MVLKKPQHHRHLLFILAAICIVLDTSLIIDIMIPVDITQHCVPFSHIFRKDKTSNDTFSAALKTHHVFFPNPTVKQ